MAQYVYGKSVVLSLLNNGRDIQKLYIQSGRKDDEIEKLARGKKIAVEICQRQKLDKLVDGNHQGYIAQIEAYPLYSIEEIITAIPQGKLPLLIALDQLQDPHNLGAIMRTAACVGADGIIIEKNRSVSLSATVAKVSAGAIDLVKVAAVSNLSQSLLALKKKNFWVVGTDASADQDYRQLDYQMPLVLVIGSEGEGLRRLIRENCDLLVKLPMENDFNSLNASVAAGIVLYRIYDQRFPLK